VGLGLLLMDSTLFLIARKINLSFFLNIEMEKLILLILSRLKMKCLFVLVFLISKTIFIAQDQKEVFGSLK
jgi:hypothetical protein